jgi:hypothetical protein
MLLRCIDASHDIKEPFLYLSYQFMKIDTLLIPNEQEHCEDCA